MLKPSDALDAAAEAVAGVTDRWAVAGAFAALRYRAEQRATTDADLLVEWRDDLVPSLEAAGYELDVIAMPGDHPHLLMSRQPDKGPIDFIVPAEPYQELALDRGAANGHVLTVEDVIVHKLIAWRPKDRDDIASILAAGHPIDEAYVEHWAAEWDVLHRWETARLPGFPDVTGRCVS